MNTPDFNTTIVVDQTPAGVFQAVTNVRGWWSEEIEGGTAKQGDEFYYHFKDIHRCTMRLTEVIPDQKIVWYVVDNYFNFTSDKSEWKDTQIIFEISRQDDKTQLKVTHLGLVPEYECYDICSNSWTRYIQESLFNLITTGQGQPNRSDNPQTADELRLSNEEQPAAVEN
ncbi:SRPBCC family protein [Flavitalea antarctica]